ncbi:MAG: hypothetical protein U0Z44_04045 [Kouleothrix sp.]
MATTRRRCVRRQCSCRDQHGIALDLGLYDATKLRSPADWARLAPCRRRRLRVWRDAVR